MKHINLILLIVIAFCTGFSQTPSLTWAKTSGYGTSLCEGKKVITDNNYNVYSVGDFNGTIDFDPGAGTYNMTGVNDVYISKLDVAGNFVWAKQVGGANYEGVFSLAIDNAGNIHITGRFTGIVDFDPGVGTYTLSAGGGNGAYVLKLDAAGNFVWAAGFGGLYDEYGYGIAVDKINGDVYSVGSFSGTVDFDPGMGSYTLASVGNGDTYISKLNSSGNFVWAKQIGGPGSETGKDIAFSQNNEVIVTGGFAGVSGADFDPGTGTYTLASFGSVDVFVEKLDANGNFIWAKQLGGTGWDDASNIAFDNIGNACITGSFASTCDFDPSPTTFTLSSIGTNDIFVCKLSNAGNLIFAKQFGDNVSSDNVEDISIDHLNCIYTTGIFDGNTDFDPGNGTYTLAPQSVDIYISKLDGNGNFIWAVKLASSGNEFSYDIFVDNYQNVYTTGGYDGITDFDPGVGTYTLAPPSLFIDPAFVHKMFQCSVATSSLSAQTNVLCNGASTGAATLQASGGSGFTYSWMPSGGTASIGVNLPAGNYSCIATNSCGNASTQTLVITQPPAITLTTVASNSIICQGSSSTLSANATGGVGSITYSWVAGPSNSISAVSPTITTAYTVNVTDANNCLKTETISITVDPCTGLNEFKMQSSSEFVMYPNPAANIVTIESIQAAKFSIVNLEGKAIEQFSVEGFKMIDISQFAQGVYFIRNSTTGQTKKLIIIKE
jgi:hypothetical protein